MERTTPHTQDSTARQATESAPLAWAKLTATKATQLEAQLLSAAAAQLGTDLVLGRADAFERYQAAFDEARRIGSQR
jgi:hypothetical protein